MSAPSLNRPLIAGLVSAISTTCHERASGRQWEALRSLWNHKALTWDEFQWLEHLEIILHRMAHENNKSGYRCLPLPGAQGWDEIVSLTNDSVAEAVQFEEDRKAHGLQRAFDMSLARHLAA